MIASTLDRRLAKQNVLFATLCALLSACTPDASSAKTSAGSASTSAKTQCRSLKDGALEDVGACHKMCPSQGANCAKSSCMTQRLAAWLEVEGTCKSLVGAYRPAYPPVTLIVDGTDDDDY